MPMHPLRQTVSLDRDGILHEAVIRNGKPFTPSEVLLLEISHQPDVSRGNRKRGTVEKMNHRKPQSGFLLHAAEQYRTDLHRSFLAGDRWPDTADWIHRYVMEQV